VSWSPDGRRLAYTVPDGRAQQVFVVNVDGTDPHPVGDPVLEGHDASWSADGQLLAFVGGRSDDEKGVYVMRTDGSDLHRIGPPSGVQWAFEYQPPVWAPTGHRLAFSARTEQVAQIFLADVDAGTQLNLSQACCDDEWGPAWSADGRYLAWQRGYANYGGLFVVAEDGSGRISVLAPPVRGAPVWSSDSTALLGYGTDPSTGLRDRLIVVDVDGGRHVEIPVGPGGDPSTGIRDRVAVVDVGGGRRVEIPAGPGGDASWQVATP
jgi:Tol biopolymer transport system component